MKRAARVVGSTVLIALCAFVIFLSRAIGYPDRHPDWPASETRVVIEKGLPLPTVARRLASLHLIEHPLWFRIYASERGFAQKIKAGQYAFSSSETPRQILEKLVEGVPVQEVSVTLAEGKNLLQVAEIFEAAGITSRDEILRLATSSSFAGEVGVEGASLEGYLYPDTYQFRRGTPARKLLARLVSRGRAALSEEKSRYGGGVAELERLYKFGDREIVILASLVEKETAQPAERPRIAGLFFNRLRLPNFVPHLLQTDPTIVYGCTVPKQKSAACNKWDGRIHRIHLEDKENRYNTYTHEGLPPGPICNPGRAALTAVLHPDRTPYLYFVSKNDGTHYFSKTRAEHEAAVNKYQRHAGQ